MHHHEEVKPPLSGAEEVRAPLLPEEAVEKIKAKETAQLQAKAERQQKRSEAERLADAVRREELRQIPAASRTAEEQRDFRRLEQRRYRTKESKGNVLSNVQTAADFWRANRLLADPRKLKMWKEQEGLVLDQIYWMNNGWACSPHDPDFVSLAEGLADLDRFVAEHGLIHDEPQACMHPDLRDFQPSWGLFTPKDTYDPIWKFVGAFYKDPDRFNALCSESPATEAYARYGIRLSLGAYQVRTFKQRLAEHQRGNLQADVQRAHLEFESDRCWLCRREAAQRARNTVESSEAEGQPPQA